jgi:glycosyltransferase involved in cell wall biosynthesis
MANLSLAQLLSDAGHAVDVITYPFGSAPSHPGVSVHRCRRFPFVKSVGIGFSPAKLLTDINLASCAARLLRRTKFDCIHAVEEGVFIAAALGRLTGTPVIYDMDSIMSHEIASSPVGRFAPAAWMMRRMERWAIKRSALVMTICDAMARYVKQVDPNKDVVVIPDIPVATSTGEPDPTRARAQVPPEFVEGRKIIVYTGSLAGYQGMDLLVSAMSEVASRHPEAVLLVVGGDDKSIDRLSKQAEAAGVMRHTRFLGNKPPEQVPDFLAMADVLVSPRRSGINPPGKIYTYMRSGRPIVATSIPAHTGVLDWGSAIYAEPSSGGLADGICWALDHPDKAAVRAERAREAVSELTPEYQARLILDAYERLLCSTGSPGTALPYTI